MEKEKEKENENMTCLGGDVPRTRHSLLGPHFLLPVAGEVPIQMLRHFLRIIKPQCTDLTLQVEFIVQLVNHTSVLPIIIN